MRGLLIALLVSVAFSLLAMLSLFFLGWVLLHTLGLLVLLLFILVALFNMIAIPSSPFYRRKKRWKRVRHMLMNGLVFVAGVGVLYALVFEVGFFNVYRDIPDYLRGDFAYVEGTVNVTVRPGGKTTHYDLAVDRIDLNYHLWEHPINLHGIRVGAYYLAHSKYVMKIVKGPKRPQIVK